MTEENSKSTATPATQKQTIADALNKLMQENDMSQSDFARAIGSTSQAVCLWVNGKTKPNAYFITAICERFGVTPASLASGRAQRTRSIALDSKLIAIPRLDVSASCGTGIVNSTEQMIDLIHVSKKWLISKCPYINLKNLEIITASGDSMSPTIKNLDFLFIDRSETTIRADGIYAVVYAGEVYVKRIQKQPDGGLLLISDNNRYPPIRITTEELSTVTVVGRCCIHCSAEEI